MYTKQIIKGRKLHSTQVAEKKEINDEKKERGKSKGLLKNGCYKFGGK